MMLRKWFKGALAIAALTLTVGGGAWAATIAEDVTEVTVVDPGDIVAADSPAVDAGVVILSDGTVGYVDVNGDPATDTGPNVNLEAITISSDALTVAGIAFNPAAAEITAAGTISVTAGEHTLGASGLLYVESASGGGVPFTGTINIAADIMVDGTAMTDVGAIAQGLSFVVYDDEAPSGAATIGGDVTVGNIRVLGGLDADSEAEGIWGGEVATTKTLTTGNIYVSGGQYAGGIVINGDITGDVVVGTLAAPGTIEVIATTGSAKGITADAIAGSVTVGNITATVTGGTGGAHGLYAAGASGTIAIGAITVTAQGTGAATALDLTGGLTGTLTMNGALTANTQSGLAYGAYVNGGDLNVTQNITANSVEGIAKGIYSDTQLDITISKNVAIKGNGVAGSFDIDLAANAGDTLLIDGDGADDIAYRQSLVVNGAETVTFGDGNVNTIELLAGSKFTGATSGVSTTDFTDLTVHSGDVFDTATVTVDTDSSLTYHIDGQSTLTSVVNGTTTGIINKTGAGELIVGLGAPITLGALGALNVAEGQLTILETVTITGGTLSTAADTVLAFNALDVIAAGTSGLLDLDSDTLLTVALGTGNVVVAAPIITDVLPAQITVGTDILTTDDEVVAYLNQFDRDGLLYALDFGYDAAGDDITLATEVNARAAAAAKMGGVMANYGLEDMTRYTDGNATNWYDIAAAYDGSVASPAVIDPNSTIGNDTAKLIYDLGQSKLGQGPIRTTREAEAVTNYLTGMDLAKSLDVAGQTARHAVGNIFRRIQQNNVAREYYGANDAYGSSILNSDFANRIWVGGMGMWENGDRYEGNAGYDYDAYGLQIGFDRLFGAVTVGGSFAYSQGDFEDKAALANDSDVDNYSFNLYATYNACNGFFASIVGGYTYSDYDLNSSYGRGWNRAGYKADTWSIGTTLGYDFRPVQNFTITPSVGIYHYSSNSDTFNTVAMRGIELQKDSTELPIALSMKYDVIVGACDTLSFEVNGGYTYNFNGDGSEMKAAGYTGINGINGPSTTLRSARHTYNIGGGITYSAARWDLGVKYDYYTSKQSDAHVLRAELGFKF